MMISPPPNPLFAGEGFVIKVFRHDPIPPPPPPEPTEEELARAAAEAEAAKKKGGKAAPAKPAATDKKGKPGDKKGAPEVVEELPHDPSKYTTASHSSIRSV